MISTDTYLLPVWIAIFVQSVTWSLSDSLPDKAAHRSPWDWDDDDWFRPRSTTRSPFIWNRYTRTPDTFNKPTLSAGPDPIVWFIVGVVLFLSLLAALIRYACAHRDDGDDYDTSPVLHPPPATIIVPPPNRTYQATTSPPPSQYSRNSTPVTLGGGIRVPTATPMYGARDIPPGYSEVVMADFVEEMKFPGVTRNLPDSPPPKYDDGNLPKY